MATLVKTAAGTWKALVRKTGWPTNTKTFRIKRDAEDTLMLMAGSLDESASSREQNLRRALDSLQHASDLHGQPFSYEIRGGNVHIRKTPSSSQSRHLGRKGSGSRRKTDTVPLARQSRTVD